MLKKVSGLLKGLRGEIVIPPDKSISHRAIMFSSLSNGRSIITNFSGGADCRSTLNIFRQLGVDIDYIDKKTVAVNSDGRLRSSALPLDAGNSGTTTRLISGILADRVDEVIKNYEAIGLTLAEVRSETEWKGLKFIWK